MSELTPKEPKTPEEKRARAHKIRTMVLDMFLPVLAALFLALAYLLPFLTGGIVLILLAAVRLALMGLIAAGVLERGVLPFPYL